MTDKDEVEALISFCKGGDAEKKRTDIDYKTQQDIIRLAGRMWDEDQGGCSWSVSNRENYIMQAAIAWFSTPTELPGDALREALAGYRAALSTHQGEG